MTFLFTARGTFDQKYDEDGTSWKKYIKGSKLTHLTELVSLDAMLNEVLVEPDYDNEEDWNCIHSVDYMHCVEQLETGFFSTQEYVIKRLKAKGKYNLMTVILNPDKDCKDINVDGYEFVGYDLLVDYFFSSALANCWVFDEKFMTQDLNNKGLIDDFAKVFDIKQRLLANNPGEENKGGINVIAVWRHKTIGR